MNLARPSAGTKIASRQARQDRKEKQGKSVFDLGGLGVFASDVMLFVMSTYASRAAIIWKELPVVAS